MHNLWNALNSQKQFQLKYPSEHVIRYISSYFTDDKSLRKDTKIADIGCGCGRHTVLLAKEGFNTYASDISESAIKATKRSLHENNVDAVLHLADTKKLSFPNNFFDGVISFGSIYYNDIIGYKKSISEIYRILKQYGVAFFVLRTTNDYRYGKGTNIETCTYKLDTNETNEEGMIIHFIDRNEIDILFNKFTIISLEKTETTFDNMNKKNSDWILIVRKL